jgi:uncharacterized protein YbjT (DUF2867 family)
VNERILITGATGNTGSIVADSLRARGVDVVAMARSEKNLARLRERGLPVVEGDFDDPPSLERALAGITRAYLVCTPDEGLVPRETAFIAAARAAGVKHIVKCSAYWAGPHAPSKNLRAHGIIEYTLKRSGLDWTILRPHGFMQTFTLIGWDMIQKAGALSTAAGDGAMPLVDVRDVAAVAVKAFTEPGHVGKEYDLTGPESLRFDQLAEVLERVLGRPVSYLPSSDFSLSLMMRLIGTTETPREHVSVVMQLVRDHKLGATTSTLADLGITPTNYETFVRDLAAGRTGGGNSFTPPDTALFRILSATMPTMMRLRLKLGGRPQRGVTGAKA